MRRLLPAFLATIAFTAMPAAPARAAASHDACTGYIDALPVVISAPGVWCLRADLGATLLPYVGDYAIDLDAADVTLDCNGYRLFGDGLVSAVYADRANATIRDCRFSGFSNGVRLSGDGGRVEANRFDRLGATVIAVGGDGSRVVGNVVTDTAASAATAPIAILVDGGSGAVVADNVIDGVVAAPGSGKDAYGIQMHLQDGASVSGNHVSGLLPDAGRRAYGIFKGNGAASLRGNSLFGGGLPASAGFSCGGTEVVAVDNTIVGFATALSPACIDGGGNVVFP